MSALYHLYVIANHKASLFLMKSFALGIEALLACSMQHVACMRLTLRVVVIVDWSYKHESCLTAYHRDVAGLTLDVCLLAAVARAVAG